MTLNEVLQRRGIRFRADDKGRVHLNCPFCSSRGKPTDTRQRLCIHVKEGWSRCMHCDWKRRNAIPAVLKQLGVAEQVSGMGVSVVQEEIPVELPEDFTWLVKPYDSLDKRAQEYILSRGVTKEQLRKYRIGVSYSGRYAYRIVFPVYSGQKLVCINGRDFTGTNTPKYLLSRGVKCLAYFNPESETCVLSEGVIKALRIEQATEFSSASLLGHDLTEVQLEQIQNSSCKHMILYPDLDRVGRKGFVKIADKLSENWKGKVSVVWPVTQAADDASLSDLRNLLDSFCLPYTRGLRVRMLLAK